MLDLVIKNIGARKIRSTLCILAVIVSVFLNGTTLTMNKWMYETMTGELAKYLGNIYVQQGGSSYPPIDSSMNQETAEIILSRTDLGLNVAESAPLLFIRTQRGMMPFLPAKEMVIGVPVGKEKVLLGNVEAAEGANHFESGEQGNVAILGEEAAESLGATVGQEVTVNDQAVRVIGILKRSSMGSINIAAVMPLEAAQRIFAQEGIVSAVLLTPNDVNKTAEIATALRRDYPTLEVVTQDDMLTEAENVLRMPTMYMSTMSITGLVVAVVVIMSTMVMAVMERTREFGTLRAIGGRRRLIMGLVLAEALSLALIGAVPGTGLVLLMSRWMNTSPPSVVQLLQVIGFALVAAVLAGAYPAWHAAQVVPVEALRYE